MIPVQALALLRCLVSRAFAACPVLVAVSLAGGARAQGCFGPRAPTVSPADAAALARACGGGDGGVAIALALQADRFADWAGRWDRATEVGGAEGYWLRVVAARRDAEGAVVAADAPGIRAAARAVRDDLVAQRRADRALLDSIIANACGGAEGVPTAAARALAAAIIRRPLIYEDRAGMVSDPLQFLECDPAVVARLVSLGAGEALVAAGKEMESALVERQFAAIDRWSEAALVTQRRPSAAEGRDADEAVWNALERAAKSIAASDPVAGAWLRLRTATDRAECVRRPAISDSEIAARIGTLPEEAELADAQEWERRRAELVAQAAADRERLELLGREHAARLVTLITQPPSPEATALGMRLVPDADAIASCLGSDGCVGNGRVEPLARRLEAVSVEIAAAMPAPRTFAVTAREVYRLSSLAGESWAQQSPGDVAGCSCRSSILFEVGWQVHAALASVDTGTITGFAPVDRTGFCRAIEGISAERAAMPLDARDPDAVKALDATRERVRTAMVAALRASIDALPPAESAAARTAALRDWALAAHPVLGRMHRDAQHATRLAARPDADARIALMDRAVAEAMERVLADLPPAAKQDRAADARGAMRALAQLRMAANAIEQAAASVSQQERAAAP